MIPVEEKFTFEISPEVRDKMDQIQEPLITEADVADLKYIPAPTGTYWTVKRILDVLCAAVGLLIALIPMALIALAIYIDDPGPVLFHQKRVGRNGKRFRFYKFRTMKQSTPKYLSTAEIENPEQYITRLGGFLRKFSLDELPQLVNVLKGDMSLIGPRPLISDEFEIHQMRMRFGVYQLRPGVTGLAQINGRDTVPPAEKVRWDVKYLERFGFRTDMSILFTTVPKVFGGNDVVEGKMEGSGAETD